MEVNLNLSGVRVPTPSVDTRAKNESNAPLSSTSANLNADINTQSQDGESKAATSAELEKLSDKLNEQMKSLQASIKFGFSNEIDVLYIKVIDEKTGEVIRQIPSEEAMRLQEYFKNAVGLLFNKES